MKTKKQSFVQAGLPSLLVIFIVLCLVTFAVLSYVSAMRDYSLSRKTADRTQLYYEADLNARKELNSIENQLYDIYRNLPQKEESLFLQECRKAFPDMNGNLLSFQLPYGESQGLFVELSLLLPQSDEDALYQITKWQVITTADWNADDSLPVFQLH